MNAVIALSECSKTNKLYAIRFERTGKDWKYTWAFPIQEKTALNEDYDKTKITGALIEGEDYPGCPHCGTKGFVVHLLTSLKRPIRSCYISGVNA